MMPFTGKLEPNIMKEDIARKEVISVSAMLSFEMYDLH